MEKVKMSPVGRKAEVQDCAKNRLLNASEVPGPIIEYNFLVLIL